MTRLVKKQNLLKRIPAIALVALAFTMSPTSSNAEDIVYQFRSGKNPARVRGKIQNINPDEVTVVGDGQSTRVPAHRVVRIVFDGQPLLLTRARERFLDKRFADCLEELDELKVSPDGKNWRVEADFLRAAVNAELALSGGAVTPQEAGTQINQFLQTHPESHLKFPAMEQLGKLLFAFGRMKNASQTFAGLAESSWPNYKQSGRYWQALSQREAGNSDQAMNLFQKVAASDINQEDSETWKLMAECQVARLQGESGSADAAIASLKKIIREENADNARLFATAFNALGSVYLTQKRLKEASIEFLKTELLYPAAVNEHAEALYYLTKTWGQLNENDRAIQAKEMLKSAYPNSWWATRE